MDVFVGLSKYPIVVASSSGSNPREKAQREPYVFCDLRNHALSFVPCPVGLTDGLCLGWKGTPMPSKCLEKDDLGNVPSFCRASHPSHLPDKMLTVLSQRAPDLQAGSGLFKQILKTRDLLKVFLYWKK